MALGRIDRIGAAVDRVLQELSTLSRFGHLDLRGSPVIDTSFNRLTNDPGTKGAPLAWAAHLGRSGLYWILLRQVGRFISVRGPVVDVSFVRDMHLPINASLTVE